MQIKVHPGKLTGSIQAISSKSQAHRMLICAALSDKPCRIYCPETNEDIDATASCLNALGAYIHREGAHFNVTPISDIPNEATLDCRESGSTLRFLLPLVGALGVSTTFIMQGRLHKRPLSPLWEEMERMGCRLCRPTETTAFCTGNLVPGDYNIDGGVSSQFITGLLFALAVLPGKSTLRITGTLQSKPYVDITRDVLSAFGVRTDEEIKGRFPFTGPGSLSVEGDWSNAAFFLAANALGNNIEVTNLNSKSFQGDREIANLIPAFEQKQVIDVSQIPDLVPILSILAAAKSGAEFINIQRLRLKESDRVASVQEMLSNMGIHTEATNEKLTIHPGRFIGCTVNSYNDHRIAMAAAIASTIAEGPIQITNPLCVNKSYPAFWQDFAKLGGSYESLEG